MVSGFKASGGLCAFLWLAFLLPGAKPAPWQTTSATIHSAREALRAHDYAKGLQLARALVQAKPGDPRAWTLEGIALSGMGRTQDGLRACRKALEIRPDFVPALEAAAQVEYNTGRWREASAHLEKLVRLNPHEETAHAMLGALAFRRKDCLSAVTHFNQSWRIVGSNVPALAEYGTCLVQTRHPDQAIPVFKRMTELEPQDWHARFNLAVVQYQAHQNREAIETLQPLVKGPKPDVDALNLVAAAYEANNQTPPAVMALQQAISLAPRNANNYLDLSTICLYHGSFQLGVDVLNAGLHLMPESAPLYVQRGVLYAEMARFSEGDADFQRANRLDPQQNIGTVAAGLALLQANKIDRSLKTLRTRLQKTPNDPMLNYLLAEILLRKGVEPGTPEFKEAEAAAWRSSRGNPHFSPAHNVLSELYLRCGKAREAIAAARLALKVDPGDQTATYNLIMGMRKIGNQAEIPRLVEQLARLTAAARKDAAERNRFKLVKGGVDSAKGTPPTFTEQ